MGSAIRALPMASICCSPPERLPTLLLAPLLQDREQLEDSIGFRSLVMGLAERTDLEVFEHGHLREYPAPLRYVADAELDDIVRSEVRDVDTVEADRAQRQRGAVPRSSAAWWFSPRRSRRAA